MTVQFKVDRGSPRALPRHEATRRFRLGALRHWPEDSELVGPSQALKHFLSLPFPEHLLYLLRE